MTEFEGELGQLCFARDYQGLRQLADNTPEIIWSSFDFFRNLFFEAAEQDDHDMFVTLVRFHLGSIDESFTGLDRLFRSGSPRCVASFMFLLGKSFRLKYQCPFGFRKDLTQVYQTFMTTPGKSSSRRSLSDCHGSWTAEIRKCYRPGFQPAGCSSESLLLQFQRCRGSVEPELSKRELDFVTIPLLARLITQNHHSTILYLIERGYDINQQDEHYGSVLHFMVALVEYRSFQIGSLGRFCSEFCSFIRILPDNEGYFPGFRRGGCFEALSTIIKTLVVDALGTSPHTTIFLKCSDIYQFLHAIFSFQPEIWNTLLPAAVREQHLPYLLQTKNWTKVRDLLSSNWVDNLTDDIHEHVICEFLAVGEDFCQQFINQETKDDWIASCQSSLTQRLLLEVLARCGHSDLCISLIEHGFQHNVSLTHSGSLYSVALELHDLNLIEATGSAELDGVELFCYKQVMKNKSLEKKMKSTEKRLSRVENQFRDLELSVFKLQHQSEWDKLQRIVESQIELIQSKISVSEKEDWDHLLTLQFIFQGSLALECKFSTEDPISLINQQIERHQEAMQKIKKILDNITKLSKIFPFEVMDFPSVSALENELQSAKQVVHFESWPARFRKSFGKVERPWKVMMKTLSEHLNSYQQFIVHVDEFQSLLQSDYASSLEMELSSVQQYLITLNEIHQVLQQILALDLDSAKDEKKKAVFYIQRLEFEGCCDKSIWDRAQKRRQQAEANLHQVEFEINRNSLALQTLIDRVPHLSFVSSLPKTFSSQLVSRHIPHSIVSACVPADLHGFEMTARPSGGFTAIDHENQWFLKLFQIDDENQLRAFIREAGILLRCHHPNVIQLIKVIADLSKGLAGIILPYYPHTLTEIAATLNVDQKKEVLRSVLDGLIYLHRSGISSRDIKSDNILLNPETSSIVISDFDVSYDEQSVSPTMRHTSRITYEYAAPELLAGSKGTPASDIYSFGKLVLFLFHPELVPLIVDAKHLSLYEEVVSPDVASLCEATLARDPSARPSISALATFPLLQSPSLLGVDIPHSERLRTAINVLNKAMFDRKRRIDDNFVLNCPDAESLIPLVSSLILDHNIMEEPALWQPEVIVAGEEQDLSVVFETIIHSFGQSVFARNELNQYVVSPDISEYDAKLLGRLLQAALLWDISLPDCFAQGFWRLVSAPTDEIAESQLASIGFLLFPSQTSGIERLRFNRDSLDSLSYMFSDGVVPENRNAAITQIHRTTITPFIDAALLVRREMHLEHPELSTIWHHFQSTSVSDIRAFMTTALHISAQDVLKYLDMSDYNSSEVLIQVIESFDNTMLKRLCFFLVGAQQMTKTVSVRSSEFELPNSHLCAGIVDMPESDSVNDLALALIAAVNAVTPSEFKEEQLKRLRTMTHEQLDALNAELRDCDTFTLRYNGIQGVPKLRVCPHCLALTARGHPSDTACKTSYCDCGKSFCFSCLNCSSHSGKCHVAPRQQFTMEDVEAKLGQWVIE